MRLQTRLGLAATAVIGITSFGISYSALIISTNSELARLNSALNLVVDGAQKSQADPVTRASELGELSAVPLTVAVVVDGSDLTVLNESVVKLNEVPSLALLASARAQPVSVRLTENYQMRTIRLDADQYVIVATSLDGVDQNTSANGVRYALITLTSVVLGATLVVWLIRREMRVVGTLIKAADDISRGETDTIIVNGGSTELSQLSHSLGRMVDSLNRSVELEKATQLRLQQFLGDASHELRTPLTVVRGYVELMSSSSQIGEQQRQRALERIQAELARMEQLIRDLLLLTELGSAPEISHSEVDLSQLVSEAVEDLKVLQPHRLVTSEIAESIRLSASESMLRQLLANAISNIARHTPDSAPALVSLRQGETDVWLTLEDGGPGLDASGYDRGIQAFKRFDQSRSRESGGSGLGMSIMAAIARRHGGSIELEPSPLGGLKLTVRLPK